MNDPQQVYDQWADKQRAVGRPVPTTTAPHYAKPKPVCICVSDVRYGYDERCPVHGWGANK